jgi:O-antigen/teichoic acid export membrane protein
LNDSDGHLEIGTGSKDAPLRAGDMSNASAAISAVTAAPIDSPDGGMMPASVVETPSEILAARELGQADQTIVLEYSKTPTIEGTSGTLKERAVRSSLFTLAGFGTSQVIRFGRTLFLTQLLPPAVFGLTAVVQLVGGLLVQFSDVGLGPAIIQSPNGDDEEFLDTAWTLSIVRGLMLSVCTMLVAWPVSRFYKEPTLFFLLLASAINPLLNGFNSTAIFSLNRHLRLGRLTLLSSGTEILQTIIIIAIATHLHNAWAIIIGGVICSIVQLIASHLLIPKYRNRFAWNKAAARELFNLGKWIVISTALTYFANESDRIMLGKLAASWSGGVLSPGINAMAVLGFYSMATALVRMPQEVISRLTGSTLFPAFAKSALGPRDEFSRIVRKARSVILPLGVTAVVGLALGAPLFVAKFYNIRFVAVGWMAQLMTIGLWITILQSSADRALLALGDAHVLAAMNFANMVITIIGGLAGFYFGVHMHGPNGTTYGVQGLILGVAAGNLGGHMVIQAALARRKVWIYWQDLKYTLFTLGITVIGLVVPKLIVPREHLNHPKVMDLIWGLFVIGIVGSWSTLRAWKWVRK